MIIKINLQSLSMSLITLLFCCFINYPLIGCNNIKFDSLIHFTQYQLVYEIYSPYQVKILIIGICSLIRNENIIENFQNLIPSLLNISCKFLKKVKKSELNSLKKKEKNEIRNNLINEEEEENNEIEEEEMTLEYVEDDNTFYEEKDKQDSIDEIKEIDYRTINPIKNIDEHKFFKETIEILKNKQYNILNKWMGDLNEEEIKSFNDIIGNIKNGKSNIDISSKLETNNKFEGKI